MMPVGPESAKAIGSSSLESIIASSSSWQILTKRSLAETAWTLPWCLTRLSSVWPTAFSFTRARKALTTPISTSASSRLSRTSRSAGSTFAAVSSVSPASRLRAWRKPFASVSNMARTC